MKNFYLTIVIGVLGVLILGIGILGFISANNSYNKEEGERKEAIMTYASSIVTLATTASTSGITIDNNWFLANSSIFTNNGVSCEEMSYDINYGVVLKKCTINGVSKYYYVGNNVYTNEKSFNDILTKNTENTDNPENEDIKVDNELTGHKVLSCSMEANNFDTEEIITVDTYYGVDGLPYRGSKYDVISYNTSEEATIASTSEKMLKFKDLDDYSELEVIDNKIKLSVTNNYSKEQLDNEYANHAVLNIESFKAYLEESFEENSGSCTIKEI